MPKLCVCRISRYSILGTVDATKFRVLLFDYSSLLACHCHDWDFSEGKYWGMLQRSLASQAQASSLSSVRTKPSTVASQLICCRPICLYCSGERVVVSLVAGTTFKKTLDAFRFAVETPQSEEHQQPERQEVNAETFAEFWEDKKSAIGDKHYSPSAVWTEILSYIKGSFLSLGTENGYLPPCKQQPATAAHARPPNHACTELQFDCKLVLNIKKNWFLYM